MASIEKIKGSNGLGNANVATVQSSRAPLATTIIVDTVLDINPAGFTGTMGIPHTFTDPVTSETITVISEATAVDFAGHVTSGHLEIDAIAPGYTDAGSHVGDIVVIRPTTQWADNIAAVLAAAHNDDGTPSPAGIHYAMPAGALVPFAGAAAPTGFLLCDGSSLLRASYAALFTAIGTAFGAADGTHFSLPDMRGRTPLGAGGRTWTVAVANTAVNTTTDQIAITANSNVYTGKAVVLTTSGGAPGGLTAGVTYYVISVDDTHIQVATTLANAVAGLAIDLTTQGSGTHTFTFTGTNHPLAETGGEDRHALVTAEMPAHTHPNKFGNTSPGDGTGLRYSGTDGTNSNFINSTGGSGSHNVLNPYLSLNYIIKT